MGYKTIKNSLKQNISLTQNDIVKLPRSTYYIKYGKRFDYNMGKLIPIGKPIEVLPGDTFDYTISTVTKLLSPQIKPVLDTLQQSIYAFFVPFRIVEKDFEKIFTGHTDTTQWDDETKEVLSTVNIPKTLFPQHSVASYMELPINENNTTPQLKEWLNEKILALPFRAYAQIWNYYFRDENIMETINVDTSNTNINGATELTNNIYDSNNSCINGGNLLPTCKKHDLFTSALPAPQKGSAVSINLGEDLPVINDTDLTNIDTNKSDKLVRMFAFGGDGNNYQTNFQTTNDSLNTNYEWQTNYINHSNVDANLSSSIDTPANFLQYGNNSIDGQDANGKNLYGISPFGSYWKKWTNYTEPITTQMYEALGKQTQLYHNLKVELSKATAISINDLRYAFQLQLIKETDARHGTRFSEYLLGHYGVVIGDARIQQPEFLGMTSFNLNSITIPQTSASDATTPQANLSSYSETAHAKHLFTKSFVEPGMIIFLTSIHQKYHVYSQKIDKFWSKKTRFDFYLAELKNIGEQPITNKELYFDPNNETKNNEVFGYQEPWYEYHYETNGVMNKASPYANNNLSVYSYADKYNATPTLSPQFLQNDDTALKNTLAIPPSGDLTTFFSDFYFINKATRPLPKHCIPGLIDHSGKIII